MINSQKETLFQHTLLKWYTKHGRDFPWRKEKASNYEIIIAELLLQRTRAETVADYFHTFINRFSSWEDLAEAGENDIAICLRPIGLWRRRSASLAALSREMVRRNGEFPKERENIEALPGIGQYIANAILLFCHQDAQPLLDANMARVLERVFGPRQLKDIRYDPYLQRLSREIIRCKNPVKMNWAILDLAGTICRFNSPRCNMCPIRPICLQYCLL